MLLRIQAALLVVAYATAGSCANAPPDQDDRGLGFRLALMLRSSLELNLIRLVAVAQPPHQHREQHHRAKPLVVA
jgi:hypothetical protein